MSGADIQTTGNVIGGRVSWLPRASLKDPNYYNIDFRLAKLFTINESMNIEVRAEAFNLFNHSQLSLRTVLSNYSQPTSSSNSVRTPSCWNGTTLTTGVTSGISNVGNPGPVAGTQAHTNTCMVPVSTFGDVSSTGGGRQMQAGIRFNF